MDRIPEISSWLLVKRYDLNHNNIIDNNGPEKKAYDKLNAAGAADMEKDGLNAKELEAWYEAYIINWAKPKSAKEFKRTLVEDKPPFYKQIAQFVRLAAQDVLPEKEAGKILEIDRLKILSIDHPVKLYQKNDDHFALLANIIKAENERSDIREIAMVALSRYQYPQTKDFLIEIVRGLYEGRYQSLFKISGMATLFVDHDVQESVEAYRQLLAAIIDLPDKSYWQLFEVSLMALKNIKGEKGLAALKLLAPKAKYKNRKDHIKAAIAEAEKRINSQK